MFFSVSSRPWKSVGSPFSLFAVFTKNIRGVHWLLVFWRTSWSGKGLLPIYRLWLSSTRILFASVVLLWCQEELPQFVSRDSFASQSFFAVFFRFLAASKTIRGEIWLLLYPAYLSMSSRNNSCPFADCCSQFRSLCFNCQMGAHGWFLDLRLRIWCNFLFKVDRLRFCDVSIENFLRLWGVTCKILSFQKNESVLCAFVAHPWEVDGCKTWFVEDPEFGHWWFCS